MAAAIARLRAKSMLSIWPDRPPARGGIQLGNMVCCWLDADAKWFIVDGIRGRIEPFGNGIGPSEGNGPEYSPSETKNND